ncbi:MAG: D-aminoacyl-tRNA deacylase [Phycisphaerae bacterium]|nr:D-aminoacyl-tRNA deacylase [Phycisphaerae bacterium]
MRAVVQRVSRGDVTIDGAIFAGIDRGLLVYLGVDADDTEDDALALAERTARLRVFPDADGKMNLDVSGVGGAMLVVSAFTVSADARRGRRPSFDSARSGEGAARLVDRFCEAAAALGVPVSRGRFGADMKIDAVNDGPVCILMDSRKRF